MNPGNTISSLTFKVPVHLEKVNVDLTDEQEPYDKDMRQGKQELVTEEIKSKERHQRFVIQKGVLTASKLQLLFSCEKYNCTS